ncbi:anthranilate phosphoribosyltransferase family protein [Myxosarcina sp. GI1]|uniref:anthranilate phosphoribosyltransferase family protein n=1 Tax=Myxosarcina sp. GI1 TaxID=1541065 RepID=UPI0005616048|nr:anthranilate phosphoribosyltransferase family protein [Myxosarcina sp. GI1]
MSDEFRELLKKVGSGVHTGKNLTRSEAEAATIMMLQQTATPAQIGAFAIAHRIKRPTPEELAGMLDAYDRLGKKLTCNSQPAIVLGNPYDGRSRTVPVTPITALILATAGFSVIMHGGERMPTKYGIPTIEIWQKLGVDFASFSLVQSEAFLSKTKIGFVYLPQYFPLAHQLVPYREQIGKRPPLATLELIWCPVVGQTSIVAGFVHPPTEERFQKTFILRKIEDYTTVKGLEGSCDLARSRTAIIGIKKPHADFERLLLHPSDYDLGGKDLTLESEPLAIEEIRAVIEGKKSELMSTAILNGGFYLWRLGICQTIAAGCDCAEKMLIKGEIADKLSQLRSFREEIRTEQGK